MNVAELAELLLELALLELLELELLVLEEPPAGSDDVLLELL